ncbi:bactofilin family protein [Haladaptatus sp. NG-WS-4]
MRAHVSIVAVVLLLATLPATAAAEQTRAGGTVVVGQGETIDDDLTATAGTVIVRGTINGDLTAFAGNVLVAQNGTVNGDASALAGNVQVEGTVTGNVEAGGGNLVVGQTGRIGGTLEGSAGSILVAGTVGEDARVVGETLRVAGSADIGGDLVYNVGTFERAPGASIGGVVRQDETLGDVGPAPTPMVPGWVGTLYGFLVNLLLGAVLLAVFPTFSENVSKRVQDDPVFSAGVGLLLLVLVPTVLIVFAITIIGIPISLLGALLFAIFLWAATVYGAFAVGVWLLSLADERNRWLGLVVGLLVVALLGQIPVLGGFVQFVVLLLGLGALALALRARYHGRREAPTEVTRVERGSDEESPAD